MKGSRQRADEQEAVVLAMLSRIERDSNVTQRHLAKDLGIALGLTNVYLKRCVKKGLVKIRQAPLRRYAYYLTARGLSEKSRLTRQYLIASLDFFRRARRDCSGVLGACRARGWRRVVLWGAGDLVEIAILSAAEAGVDVVCIVDPASSGGRCAGHSIVRSLNEAATLAAPPGVQAVLVADMLSPGQSLCAARAAATRAGIGQDRVLVVDLTSIATGSEAETPIRGRTRDSGYHQWQQREVQ